MRRVYVGLLLVAMLILASFASFSNLTVLEGEQKSMEATDGFYNSTVWNRGMFPSLSSVLGSDMWIEDHFRISGGGGVIVGTIDNDQNGYTVYEIGPVNITVHNEENMFVAKYDANNTFVWAQTARKSTGEVVTVDTNGNVFISGYLKGNAPFGTTVLTSSSSTQEVYYAALSSSGGWLWAKLASQAGHSRYGQLEVNSNTNELYFCGYSGSTTTLDSVTIAAGGYVGKMFTNNGTLIMAKSIGGSSGHVFGSDTCELSLGVNSTVVVAGLYSDDFTLDGVGISHIDSTDILVLNFHSNLSLNQHYTLAGSHYSACI